MFVLLEQNVPPADAPQYGNVAVTDTTPQRVRN